MSLQVWMPLNGNINNQGLSEVALSGTPKYYTNGKLSSQCLDMSAAITGAANGLTGATEWSAAFWYKIDNNDSLSKDWVRALSLEDQTADNSTIGEFRFETCYSSSASSQNKGLHWHDNSVNAIVTDYAWVSYDREVWHHACITVSPTKGIHTYCDGTLVHTSSKSHNGGHLTGNFKIGYSNLISGGIQDIRLYDHCLSAKEVVEISKGLILHYKLDNKGMGGANYINNSGPNIETLWSISTNWTGSVVDCPTAPLGKCMRTTAGSNGITGGMHMHPWAKTNYVDGELYTISAYIRSNVDGLRIAFKNETMVSNNVINLSTEWKYYSFTSTINTNAQYYSDIFYITDKTQVTTGTYIEVHSLKFEKGSKATPWCPSSADGIYNTLGFNSTEEVDCSGFGNNGTMVGTFTYDTNTPRYAVSTVFNGTDNYIDTNLPESVLGNNWTISFWSYAAQRPTGSAKMGVVGMHSSLSESNYTGMVIMQLAASANQIALGNGSNWEIYYFTKTIEVGKWYHVVVTYDNSSAKYYLNGVLDGSQTRNFVPYSNIVIGQTHTDGKRFWNGRVSDFRVYTTTLTPNQVKELYDTAASVDKNGNLLCYEMEER